MMLNADRVKQRLQRAMDETDWKPRPLSEAAGLGATWVRDFLGGRVRSPKVESLRQIGAVLGVPLGYFTAEAEPPALERLPVAHEGGGEPSAGLVIREYDVGASAGHGAEPPVLNGGGETPILAEWSMPEDLVRAHTTPSRRLALIRVEGNSMEPDFHPGERVLVDLSRRKPSPPGEFVIWDGMGLVLKRVELVPGSEPKRIRLISINPGYTPYEVELDEHTIVARVIGKWQWR
jgi:transcriptional regulator with XRE-family HTH domain